VQQQGVDLSLRRLRAVHHQQRERGRRLLGRGERWAGRKRVGIPPGEMWWERLQEMLQEQKTGLIIMWKVTRTLGVYRSMGSGMGVWRRVWHVMTYMPARGQAIMTSTMCMVVPVMSSRILVMGDITRTMGMVTTLGVSMTQLVTTVVTTMVAVAVTTVALAVTTVALAVTTVALAVTTVALAVTTVALAVTTVAGVTWALIGLLAERLVVLVVALKRSNLDRMSL
jgi:mediator of RNA polymerase II transcription subunit 4